MVEFKTEKERLKVLIRGFHKFLTFKSTLEVHKHQIAAVYHCPNPLKGVWKGVRSPGVYFPGWLCTGTFHRGKTRHFWDAKKGGNCVVVELENHPYDRLVVDVADGNQAVGMLRNFAGLQNQVPIEMKGRS